MRLNAGKAYSSLKHTSGKSVCVCVCAHAMIMFKNGAYVIESDSIALAGKWWAQESVGGCSGGRPRDAGSPTDRGQATVSTCLAELSTATFNTPGADRVACRAMWGVEKQVPCQQVCESMNGQHFAGCLLIARPFQHLTVHHIYSSCRCETWVYHPKGFTKLRMFENRVKKGKGVP